MKYELILKLKEFIVLLSKTNKFVEIKLSPYIIEYLLFEYVNDENKYRPC